MAFASEISRTRSGGASGRWRARASAARQAYSALAESFMARGVGPSVRRIGSVRFGSELAAVERVEAAFGLGLAGPAARPLVRLARGDRPGAGSAADRRIAPVVQRVVGDLVRHHERPDVPV